MAHVTDFMTDKQFKARILSTVRLTPENVDEIREITIEVDNPGFKFQIDQSFGVLIEVEGPYGNTHHHRLYSVADIPETKAGKPVLKMLVKRCSYVDEFNGELYDGVASNYLCDRRPGDTITITGPHSLPFKVPEDKTANLILIGMGTGIAPFRAFIKHVYKNEKDWKGKIRLFYGARSGLELLYLNDKDGDLTQYYDEATFEAFHALSPRPHWDDPIAIDTAIEERAGDVLDLLNQTNTYIYVAGYEAILDILEKTFSRIMMSEDAWKTRKAELKAGNKWKEIVY